MCCWLPVGGEDAVFLPGSPSELADCAASWWNKLNYLLPNVNSWYHYANAISPKTSFRSISRVKTTTVMTWSVSYYTVVIVLFRLMYEWLVLLRRKPFKVKIMTSGNLFMWCMVVHKGSSLPPAKIRFPVKVSLGCWLQLHLESWQTASQDIDLLVHLSSEAELLMGMQATNPKASALLVLTTSPTIEVESTSYYFEGKGGWMKAISATSCVAQRTQSLLAKG